MVTPSAASTSGSLGVTAVMPRKPSSPKRESTVTGTRRRLPGERHGAATRAGVEQAEPVVAHQDAVHAGRGSRAARPAPRSARRGCASARRVALSMRTICCFVEWMPPAQDAGLHRRHVAGLGAITPRAAMPRLAQQRAQAPSVLVLPDDAHRERTPAQGADVVDGVGTAAQAHVGAVVLEDEHRRLAAHPLRRDRTGTRPPRGRPAPGCAGPRKASIEDRARGGHPAAGSRASCLRRCPSSAPPGCVSTASSRCSATRSGGRGQARGVELELAQAVACLHQHAAGAHRPGELEVAVPVADHVRRARSRPRCSGRALEQPGPRLAAVAVLPVGRLARRRVVRAVVDPVEAGAVRRQRRVERARGPRGSATRGSSRAPPPPGW